MQWTLSSDRPIYAQLTEQLTLRIITGAYGPGQRLPSVRELAAEAAVNPNTMQKALAQLEQNGLVFTQRTSGRFITEDLEMIVRAKNAMAKNLAAEFVEKALGLGLSAQEIKALLETILKEGK